MDNQLGQPRVRPIFAYIKDSLKFYDTDKPVITQIVFILQLAIVFGGYLLGRPYIQELFILFEQYKNRLQEYLSSNNMDVAALGEGLLRMGQVMTVVLIIMLGIKALTFIISLFYGVHYYYSQTQPEMKSYDRTLIYFRRLPKIIAFNILFYLALGAISLSGMIVLVFPIFANLMMLLPLILMVVNTLFIFKDLLIIEFDVKVFRNFKKSLDITRGCRRAVIMNGLWPFFLSLLTSLFSVDVQNPTLSLFIASFMEVIFLLVAQRLTVLMFLDAASIERRAKPTKTKAKTAG